MSDSKDINIYMDSLGSLAKDASRILAQTSEEQKNEALLNIAKTIDLKRQDILNENIKDLAEAKKKQIGDALIDRLELTEERIDSMISGLKVVSDLPDPVGPETKILLSDADSFSMVFLIFIIDELFPIKSNE